DKAEGRKEEGGMTESVGAIDLPCPHSPLGREASPELGARQISERVLPYPPRRGVVRAGQATGQGDGRGVECGASPPYGPERPANTLLDEVALVGGRALDERKGPEERTVSGLLVMERQAGQKGKGGPLHELVPPPAPGCNLPPRVRRPVEEAEADGVAHTP